MGPPQPSVTSRIANPVNARVTFITSSLAASDGILLICPCCSFVPVFQSCDAVSAPARGNFISKQHFFSFMYSCEEANDLPVKTSPVCYTSLSTFPPGSSMPLPFQIRNALGYGRDPVMRTSVPRVRRLLRRVKITNVLDACEFGSGCVESKIHLGRVRFNLTLVGLGHRWTHPKAHLSRSNPSLL